MSEAVCLIDGPSLWNMMRCLGVGKWDQLQLYSILTQEVAGVPKFKEAVYVLNPAGAYLESSLARIGYSTVVRDSKRGEDDEMIIEKIKNLRPDEVSDLVLVSADSDYYGILREKSSLGIRIHLVASRAASDGGRPFLSNVMLDPQFHVVDLADYKTRLMIEPRLSSRSAEAVEEFTEVKPEKIKSASISLQISEDSAMIYGFMAELMQFLAKYPSVDITLSVK